MKNILRLIFILTCIIILATAVAQNSPAPIKLIEFVLTPNHADWNYKVNENAFVQVSVLKFGVPVDNVTINYEIGPEMLPAEKKESMVLKKGIGSIDITTSKQPG